MRSDPPRARRLSRRLLLTATVTLATLTAACGSGADEASSGDDDAQDVAALPRHGLELRAQRHVRRGTEAGRDDRREHDRGHAGPRPRGPRGGHLRRRRRHPPDRRRSTGTAGTRSSTCRTSTRSSSRSSRSSPTSCSADGPGGSSRPRTRRRTTWPPTGSRPTCWPSRVTGVRAVRPTKTSIGMETVYADLQSLGKIFDVPEKADRGRRRHEGRDRRRAGAREGHDAEEGVPLRRRRGGAVHRGRARRAARSDHPRRWHEHLRRPAAELGREPPGRAWSTPSPTASSSTSTAGPARAPARRTRRTS